MLHFRMDMPLYLMAFYGSIMIFGGPSDSGAV